MTSFVHNTNDPVDFMKKQKAHFRPAAIFSDHAVFQRDKNFTVFGECPKASELTAFLYHEGRKIASASGHSFSCPDQNVFGDADIFKLVFPAQKAGAGYELEIICSEESKKYTDLVFGDVFLAGGQSNMELEIRTSAEGADALRNDKNPNVRFFYTQKCEIFNQHFADAEGWSGWQTFSEENAKAWSAVGYYCAREIAERTGVTVGIIGCNWGGTSATAWLSREILEADRDLNTYIEDYEKAIDGRSLEEQKAEWQEYSAYSSEWQKKIDAEYAKNPSISWDDAVKVAGECKYPGPLNSFNPMRPAGLYELMIKRVAPYTIKGFLYYQGESDDHKPHMYRKLLSKMIQCWRGTWNDLSLPFYMVQLPMHQYVSDPDYKHWCKIRQAQFEVSETVKNTGMAVALDCGAWNEIHPKKKTVVGHRLALLVLNGVYGMVADEAANGPIYDHSIDNGDDLQVCFRFASTGFVQKEVLPDLDPNPSEKINSTIFEISEDGENWKPASVKSFDKNTITLNKSLSNPRFIRWAWTNYGKVTLFGKNGIPVAPFTAEIG